jgi:hypothetical protein
MNNDEFHEWFFNHVNEMVENGIMHPDSQAGKWIKLALTASHSHYEKRLTDLEDRIMALEGNPPKPKKIIEPVVKKQSVQSKPVVKQQWL